MVAKKNSILVQAGDSRNTNTNMEGLSSIVMHCRGQENLFLPPVLSKAQSVSNYYEPS